MWRLEPENTQSASDPQIPAITYPDSQQINGFFFLISFLCVKPHCSFTLLSKQADSLGTGNPGRLDANLCFCRLFLFYLTLKILKPPCQLSPSSLSVT